MFNTDMNMYDAIKKSSLHQDLVRAYLEYIGSKGYIPTPNDVKECERCFLCHIDDIEECEIDENDDSIVIIDEWVFNING